MGCAISQLSGGKSSYHEITISNPTPVLYLIPAPERDENSMPIVYQKYEHDRKTLVEALGYVSERIHSFGRHFTIIAIGGAVSTILLSSGNTCAVDFFTADSTLEEAAVLRYAAKYAAARSSVYLQGDWFNNSVVVFIPRVLRTQLLQEAVEQNDILFKEEGLTVFAPPWKYALCMKLNRISQNNHKLYEIKDASLYLGRYFDWEGRKPFTVEAVQDWAAQYSLLATTEAIRKVNVMYYQKYHMHAVLFDTAPVESVELFELEGSVVSVQAAVEVVESVEAVEAVEAVELFELEGSAVSVQAAVEVVESVEAVELFELEGSVVSVQAAVEVVEAVEMVEAVESVEAVELFELEGSVVSVQAAVEVVEAVEMVEAVEAVQSVEAVEAVEAVEPVE